MIFSLVNTSVESIGHLNLILLFGLIILCGTFGSRLSQKIHVPQVVGCVIVGLLLGDIFNVITQHTIELIRPFTMFALGIIGFMIGGELRGDVFKKYGKQFFIILFSQGIGTFLLVAVATSIVGYLVFGRLLISIAMGLVFGAIASATAPASTANVLWEYKTRGPLTAAVLAIVALDDALALLLYRAAATSAKAIMGIGGDGIMKMTAILLGEIIGAVLLGFLLGIMLYYILKYVRANDKILEFSISCLLLVVGVSIIFDIDPILPAMTLGITIANMMPRRSKAVFELIEKFSPPIYTAFFVLAGAHIQLSKMALPVAIMTATYIFFRVLGKMAGSWAGAKFAGAPATVQKYLGICLLPQAGVAIGLAILSRRQFNAELGHIIIMVVMTETFIIEILGPVLVKIGVKKAGEVGLNVTEEDLIKTYTVEQIMDTKPVTIPQDLSLQQILETFGSTESLYYPVVDSRSRIVGKVTIAGIKEMFANRDVAGWLLACDVAEPIQDKIAPAKPLEEAIELMRRYDLENIPVVANDGTDKLVGILDYRKTLRKISTEVLNRRKAADEMALATL